MEVAYTFGVEPLKHTAMRTILFFLSLVLLSGCFSVSKNLSRGNYDKVIDYSLGRIHKGKKATPELVTALESAFAAAQAKDLEAIAVLEKQGDRENWSRIHVLASGVKARQNKIKAVLPVRDVTGYTADFDLVSVDLLLQESADKAAAHYYLKGLDELEKGRRGDKLAARYAYDWFDKAGTYNSARLTDLGTLRAEATELGTTRVLVKLDNRSVSILPLGMETEMLRSLTRENDRWLELHTIRTSGLRYDLVATATVDGIAASPERVDNFHHKEFREIQDGWVDRLDNRGKPVKDSTGKVLQDPRMIKVRADVREVYQYKDAALSMNLELRDEATGAIYFHQSFSKTAVFENRAVSFRGDRRALSEETKCRLGGHEVPFPATESMVMGIVDDIADEMARAIARESYRTRDFAAR